MLQKAMIERVRHLCRLDKRFAAAMAYGSFGSGNADRRIVGVVR